MEVYIVEISGYESSYIVGIFTTYEKSLEFSEKFIPKRLGFGEYISIHKYEVDHILDPEEHQLHGELYYHRKLPNPKIDS